MANSTRSPESDPSKNSLLWTLQWWNQRPGPAIVLSALLVAVPAATNALVRPTGSSSGWDRLWSGVVGALIGLALISVILGLFALVAAPRLQRNQLLRERELWTDDQWIWDLQQRLLQDADDIAGFWGKTKPVDARNERAGDTWQIVQKEVQQRHPEQSAAFEKRPPLTTTDEIAKFLIRGAESLERFKRQQQ